MRHLLPLVLLIGCAHRPVVSRDATLPEHREALETQEPEAVLAQAAEQLDPTPRARALGALIRQAPEPGGHPWAQRGLWDPSPWVQRAAVDAVGARLPEPEAVGLLRDYVQRERNDPYVRGRAGVLLAPSGDPDAAEGLRQACRAHHLAWHAAPLCLASALHGDDQAVERLGQALASGDIALEVDFLLDVGDSGLQALIPSLRRGAELVEEELRLPYAVARIGLGDASGEQLLRRALAAPDPQLRLEALDYVSRLTDPTARPLLRRAQSQGPEIVRWYAQLALAARQGELDRLDKAAAHPDQEIRALAVRFAAEAWSHSLGSKRASRLARNLILRGLDDPHTVVRLAALDALAEVRLEGAQALAQANLHHHQEEVRMAAAVALLTMGR